MSTLSAWVWPPPLPPPPATGARHAGDLLIHHPQPDAIAPRALLGALRDGHRDLAAITTPELVRILGGAGEALTRDVGECASPPPRAGPPTRAPPARAAPPPRGEPPRPAATPPIRDIAANARLSPEMARTVLDGMAASWHTRALDRLVSVEFPDRRVLDGFAPESPAESVGSGAAHGRLVRAAAPPVTLHFGAGSVPGVTVTSMIRALLVKSAVLVKPGAGDIALTVRFARLLHHSDPRLARAVAVQYWPGGAPEWDGWERGLLQGADQVVVYGSDETIEAVRGRAPASARLIEHPHRVGVAIVDPNGAPESATAAARAAALFDQRGCVSTHLVLLLGTPDSAANWCGDLARCLMALEAELPAGPATPGELSSRHQLSGRLAMRAAASRAVRIWSADGADWSVVLSAPEAFEPGGGRTVWVVPVAGRSEALKSLSQMSPVLQTVGLAGLGGKPSQRGSGFSAAADRTSFAEALFALGATRIVPLDQIAFPEADWFHDGNRPLRELVRWGELR